MENRADVRVNGQRLKEQPERIQPCADQPFASRSLQRGLKVEAEATQEQQKAAAVERHAQRRAQQRANGAAKDGARRFLIIGQERLEQAERGQGKEESERAAIQRLRAGQNERAKQCPCANAQTQHDCADRQQNGEKERIRRVNRTGKGGQHGRRKRHRAAEHRNQIRRGEIEQPADERRGQRKIGGAEQPDPERRTDRPADAPVNREEERTGGNLRAAALGGIEHDGCAGIGQIREAKAMRDKDEQQREKRGAAKRFCAGAGKNGGKKTAHNQKLL